MRNAFPSALAGGILLILAPACDSKGGASAPVAAVTVAPPVLTARDSIAMASTAHVSTQAQPGCAYTWTITGDPKARIGFGQGTSAISVLGFSAGGETVTVSVTVRALAGGSSASGSISIHVVTPVEGQV